MTRADHLHLELGNTLVIPRNTGPWRAPLLFTITAVRLIPESMLVSIDTAERGENSIQLPPDATVIVIQPGRASG